MTIEAYRDHTPNIDQHAFVHASADVIGNVYLGRRSSVWPGVVIRGDVNLIRIGADSNVQDNSTLHVSRPNRQHPNGAPLLIGEQVTIGHAVILHGCKIGNRCLIGMGSLVMDHAALEDEVLLAAGSLVPEGKRLESGWLYMGRPAQKIRPLTAPERQDLAAQATHYVTLAAEYLGNKQI